MFQEKVAGIKCHENSTIKFLGNLSSWTAEREENICLKGLLGELIHVNVLFISFQGYSDIRESSIL